MRKLQLLYLEDYSKWLVGFQFLISWLNMTGPIVLLELLVGFVWLCALRSSGFFTQIWRKWIQNSSVFHFLDNLDWVYNKEDGIWIEIEELCCVIPITHNPHGTIDIGVDKFKHFGFVEHRHLLQTCWVLWSCHFPVILDD